MKWYRSSIGKTVHMTGCRTPRCHLVEWIYADGMDAEQVAAVVAETPWLSLCGHCCRDLERV